MSLRFIIGRAGTGKTHHCFNAIVDACAENPLGGPAILWLVPKQTTFTAERELACNSGLPAISRARVVSFEQLARDILEECGGAAMPLVTPVGRQMVIGHLLREHRDELKYFNTVAHHPGFAAELDSAFGEFERAGKSATDLAELIASIDGSDAETQSLAAKLTDLHRLFDAYGKFIGDEQLDPHRRLTHVLDCVEHSKRLRGASVYVDGFFDFTENERRLIAALAKVAGNVEITLRLDPNSPLLKNPDLIPEEMGVFNLIETTYRKLHFTLKEADVPLEVEPLVFRKVQRFKSHALEHIETTFTTNHVKPTHNSSGVSMIEAPDRRSEVDAVARHIQSLVAEGFRYREIVVLVRKLDVYDKLIEASFHEHGLPWFVDRRRTASHHPLIRFTRALPTIALHNWDHDALMSLLKSGLLPLTFGEKKESDLVDRLENFVIDHRIRGELWASEEPWSFRKHRAPDANDEADNTNGYDEPTADDRLATEMDAVRRQAILPLMPFVQLFAADRAIPVKQLVASLINVFEACHVRETLSGWIQQAADDDDLEQQAEHAQVWNELTDLLDQMVDLLGEQPISGADFAAILDAGLESFDLAITPPAVDQILVGSIDRTRTPGNTRVCIVMGLHEGGFPFAAKESSIFGDTERTALGRRNLNLEPESKRRLLDEQFYGYVAFTRASERLCLTRPTTDSGGRPLTESSFWSMINRALGGKIETQKIARQESESTGCIGTPRQLTTRLMQWVRDVEHADVRDDAHQPWSSLYNSFASYSGSLPAIQRLRTRAWAALSYTNAADLSPAISAKLFPNMLRASVSRLETFAACPFKHFAGYVLKLSRREEADVTALDLGNVYHGILENLVREMVSRRHDFATAPEAFTDAQIHQYARQIGESLRHELLLSNARNQYLLEHVERTIDLVVDTHREAARRGEFRPWQTELTFGLSREDAQASLPAFEIITPAKHTMQLNGRIDRVDWIEDRAAFAVIDYKLTGNKLELGRVYHGLSLQLLTYLLVLQASGKALAGKPLTPAAAFYVKLMRSLQSVDHPDEATPADDAEFHLQHKPRGIFDSRFLSSLDSEFTRGKSQVVNAVIKNDGTPGANTDAAEPNEFAALIDFTRIKLGELGDQIIGGSIAVLPYRIGTNTPCPHCDYRSVCRFDPARESYRNLNRMGREQVIQLAVERMRK